jgi:hypothetical protein
MTPPQKMIIKYKLILLGLLILVPWGCVRPSFVHYSIPFVVPSQGMTQKVPDSGIYLTLISIDEPNNKCLFKLTEGKLNETVLEWVTAGEFFHSAWWLGTRGLRLNEIVDHGVRLERFSAK